MWGVAISLSYDGGGQGSEAWGHLQLGHVSLRDAQGRLGNLANPPTSEITDGILTLLKIIIPISDENVNDGFEDATDRESVDEAHDACVLAGISPVPLWAGGGQFRRSQMRDLANVRTINLGTPSVARYCPGGTPRTSHAQGGSIRIPNGRIRSIELQFMVEALIYLATNASREIFLTVLDPYALLENPWVGFSLANQLRNVSHNVQHQRFKVLHRGRRPITGSGRLWALGRRQRHTSYSTGCVRLVSKHSLG